MEIIHCKISTERNRYFTGVFYLLTFFPIDYNNSDITAETRMLATPGGRSREAYASLQSLNG